MKLITALFIGLYLITCVDACEKEKDFTKCINNTKCSWFSTTANEKCQNIEAGCQLREKATCNDEVCQFKQGTPSTCSGNTDPCKSQTKEACNLDTKCLYLEEKFLQCKQKDNLACNQFQTEELCSQNSHFCNTNSICQDKTSVVDTCKDLNQESCDSKPFCELQDKTSISCKPEPSYCSSLKTEKQCSDDSINCKFTITERKCQKKQFEKQCSEFITNETCNQQANCMPINEGENFSKCQEIPLNCESFTEEDQCLKQNNICQFNKIGVCSAIESVCESFQTKEQCTPNKCFVSENTQKQCTLKKSGFGCANQSQDDCLKNKDFCEFSFQSCSLKSQTDCSSKKTFDTCNSASSYCTPEMDPGYCSLSEKHTCSAQIDKQSCENHNCNWKEGVKDTCTEIIDCTSKTIQECNDLPDNCKISREGRCYSNPIDLLDNSKSSGLILSLLSIYQFICFIIFFIFN